MAEPNANSEITPAVISAFNKGNQLAFKTIYDHFDKRLQHFIWKLTGSNEIAGEIANDVFLKLWQLQESFETYTNIKAFLYIAARNRSLNHIKKEARERKHFKEYSDLYQHWDQVSETAFYESELADVLQRLIEQLPERQREVMKATLNDDLKVPEIAEQMDITKDTVYGHKKKAIATLKELGGNNGSVLMVLVSAGCTLLNNISKIFFTN